MPDILEARSFARSVVRSGLSMAILILMQQFLAGVLAGQGGLAGYLAIHLGRTPALYAVAGLLFACCLASSALAYEGQMVEQRVIRAFELGLLDRLRRRARMRPGPSAGWAETWRTMEP